MQKRFRGYAVLSVIIKIIGGFNLLISIASLILFPLAFSADDGLFASFGIISTIPSAGLLGGFAAGLVIFIVAGLAGIVMLGVAALIDILTAIEENTRATVILQQAAARE